MTQVTTKEKEALDEKLNSYRQMRPGVKAGQGKCESDKVRHKIHVATCEIQHHWTKPGAHSSSWHVEIYISLL